MLKLKDRTVVITGGATGIGLGLAKACGEKGARILIGEPRPAHLNEAVSLLRETGVSAHGEVVDVSSVEQLTALADVAFNTLGDVALVMNNAGIGQRSGAVLDTPLEELQRVMSINFQGVWQGCQVFGRRLIKQGCEAAIYNTGSENSFFVAVHKAAAYVASKHAVLGLTDALREEMPEHITVGMIAPGFVATELIPEAMRHLGMPIDEFAAITLPQILKGERYVVSHGYNQVRIDERYQLMRDAYTRSAPRQEGDERYDVTQLRERYSK